jgi:hypothetical protein
MVIFQPAYSANASQDSLKSNHWVITIKKSCLCLVFNDTRCLDFCLSRHSSKSDGGRSKKVNIFSNSLVNVVVFYSCIRGYRFFVFLVSAKPVMFIEYKLLQLAIMAIFEKAPAGC